VHILTFLIRTDGFAEPPIPNLAAKPPTGPGWVRGLVDEPVAGDRPDSRRALHSFADFWGLVVV
jgi:hypothetical protein